MKFSVFQVSRKGGREKNEDRMGYSYTRASGIFLLADGMGGHPDGEVAAQLALQSISASYQQSANPLIEDVRGFLTDALLAAHRQILRYAVERGMNDTPRTTIVVALVQEGRASWIHCGDSRLYLVRDGELIVRTRDHSYMEQPEGMGGTRPEAQKNRNILFTCLGSPIKPILDMSGPISLQQGDRILLCSDGLWGSLADQDIVYQLANKPVEQAVPDLVENALLKAGANSDNVTVIALEWETPDGFEATRASISTDDFDDGEFASTVQADVPGAALNDPNDLNDADIERSIAEINDAIRRSAARKR
jgi:serine/threonine protein phosphatase PrpC